MKKNKRYRTTLPNGKEILIKECHSEHPECLKCVFLNAYCTCSLECIINHMYLRRVYGEGEPTPDVKQLNFRWHENYANLPKFKNYRIIVEENKK
jgi:hypothetical protein